MQSRESKDFRFNMEQALKLFDITNRYRHVWFMNLKETRLYIEGIESLFNEILKKKKVKK